MLVVSSKHLKFLTEYSDRLELQILENNYYNKSTVGIDEEIFVELERRPKVESEAKQSEIEEDEESQSESEHNSGNFFGIIDF